MNRLGKNPYSFFVPEIVGTNKDGSLKTKDGNVIDMMCGSSCAGFGYKSVSLKKALNRILKDNIPTNTYTHDTVWREEAEKELEKFFPNYEFVFCCGGCEAIEIAFKLVKSLKGENATLAGFSGCFHGKSHFVGKVSENEISANTKSLTFNKPLNEKDLNGIDAIVLEPIQLRNGVNIADKQFLESIISACKKTGTIYISDEISCNIRCGHLNTLAAMTGYEADIITLGKNIAQGFMTSVVCVHKRLKIDLGKKGITNGFGGNPLACAVITETLKQAEKTALANQKKGAEFLEIMKKTLSSSKSVSGIFGYGMYFSISFNKKLDLENIFKVLIKKGFIIGVIGDKIRLAPPFDTTKETWQRLVNDIKEVIE